MLRLATMDATSMIFLGPILSIMAATTLCESILTNLLIDSMMPKARSDSPMDSACTGKTEYKMVSPIHAIEVIAAASNAPCLALDTEIN